MTGTQKILIAAAMVSGVVGTILVQAVAAGISDKVIISRDEYALLKANASETSDTDTSTTELTEIRDAIDAIEVALQAVLANQHEYLVTPTGSANGTDN